MSRPPSKTSTAQQDLDRQLDALTKDPDDDAQAVRRPASRRSGSTVTKGPVPPTSPRWRVEGVFVLLFDDGIGQSGVDDRYIRGAVPEHSHDRLDASAAFGELCADGMPDPVRGDGSPCFTVSGTMCSDLASCWPSPVTGIIGGSSQTHIPARRPLANRGLFLGREENLAGRTEEVYLGYFQKPAGPEADIGLDVRV